MTAATGCRAGTQGATAGITLIAVSMIFPRLGFFSSGVSSENPFLNVQIAYLAGFSRFECPLGYSHVLSANFVEQAIVGEYY
jgi:hypothetical protein